jgi:hypothetical protein
MKSKLMETNAQGARTFVIVFDTGEEAVAGLQAFAADNKVDGAQISAIGALERGVVAWLNWKPRHMSPFQTAHVATVTPATRLKLSRTTAKLFANAPRRGSGFVGGAADCAQ